MISFWSLFSVLGNYWGISLRGTESSQDYDITVLYRRSIYIGFINSYFVVFTVYIRLIVLSGLWFFHKHILSLVNTSHRFGSMDQSVPSLFFSTDHPI